MKPHPFLFLAMSVALVLLTCGDPPVNPADDLSHADIMLFMESPDTAVIAGTPVEIGIGLTLTRHIRNIALTFSNSACDTVIAYTSGNEWYDTLFVSGSFLSEGKASIAVSAELSDGSKITDVLIVNVRGKPFLLRRETEDTLVHFAVGDGDTVRFDVEVDWKAPDSVRAFLHSRKGAVSMPVISAGPQTYVPLTFTDQGNCTLHIIGTSSAYTAGITFAYVVHYRPSFDTLPESEGRLALGLNELMTFTVKPDSLDTSRVRLLNAGTFRESEISVISEDYDPQRGARRLSFEFSPADTGRYRFEVEISNGFFHDTAEIVRIVEPNLVVYPTMEKRVLEGQAALFESPVKGSGVQYFWTRDGKTIGGASQVSYTVPAVSASDDSAEFRCVAYRVAAPAVSSGALLRVAYRVLYAGNSQTAGEVPVDTGMYVAHEKAIVLGNTGGLRKTGYVFGGWELQRSSGVLRFDSGDTLAAGSSHITLTALWVPVRSALTFDSNGGEGTMESLSLPTDSQLNLPENHYVRAGYSFGGWSRSVNGPVEYGNQGALTMGPADMKLYASWTLLPPVITGQPRRVTVDAGSRDVALQVDVTGDSLTFQWYKDGVRLGGGRTPRYLFAEVTLSDTGEYHCVVSNRLESVVSDTAVLSVTPAPWIPSGPLERNGKMVKIRAAGFGFLMGADAEGLESPAHTVAFTKDFFMDTSEVTQGEYLSLMNSNPSFFKDTLDPAVSLTRPVESMGWYGAALYCNEKSKREGLDTVYLYGADDPYLRNCVIDYSQNGYRLPTEAEWEYACRAGTTSKWYWGDDNADEYAWHSGNSGLKTQPVARKRPNTYGLYDMSGNVREFCNDWAANYAAVAAQVDPTGPQTGIYYINRGGTYEEPAGSSTLRSYSPFTPARWQGFRVVRPIK